MGIRVFALWVCLSASRHQALNCVVFKNYNKKLPSQYPSIDFQCSEQFSWSFYFPSWTNIQLLVCIDGDSIAYMVSSVSCTLGNRSLAPRDHRYLEVRGKRLLQAFLLCCWFFFSLISLVPRKIPSLSLLPTPNPKPLCCAGIISYNNINISLELITFGVIVPYWTVSD